MKNPIASKRLHRRPQRGDVMLIVLIFLLVFMLGLVVSMRDSITATQLVGYNAQHQRDSQMGDVALAQVEALMVANSASTGEALEYSVGTGSSQPSWWRDVSAGAGPPANPSYWQSCTLSTATATTRCASLHVTNNGTDTGYTMLAVVQPTGRTSKNSCNVGALVNASYYDIYLRIADPANTTTSITETVYKLCTR